MSGTCYKCKKKIVYPTCTYDTAYPIDWCMSIQKVTGMPCIGICWRYGPEDGILGRPAAICDCGRALLEKARALEEQA